MEVASALEVHAISFGYNGGLLLKEPDRRIVGPAFVVPVAHDDVPGNQVDGRRRAVLGRFPFAVPGRLAVQEQLGVEPGRGPSVEAPKCRFPQNHEQLARSRLKPDSSAKVPEWAKQ